MPPLALASLLHRSLPWLSTPGRAVVNWLVCFNGRVGSTDALVQRLGLANRYSLSRLLRAEGLPPFEELSGWVCVLYWMLRADAEGATLRALARETGFSVAGSYRLVRRITGKRWTQLRQAGLAEAVRLLTARCRPPTSLRRGGRARSVRVTLARPTAPSARRGGAFPLRLPLPGGPCDIAVHPASWAYVTRVHAAALERIDLAAGTWMDSVPVGCAPSCIALGTEGRRAYVSAQYDDAIAVIDTAQHACIEMLRIGGDPFPVCLAPGGRTLYVTTNEDRLYALGLPHGRILATLPLPATSHHLSLHPAGHRLYVATRAAGTVLEIDTARCQQLRSFALGGWTQGLALSADGATLFVANEKDGVNVVHLRSGRHVATIPLAGGPCELALSPDQRHLYVSLVHAGKVVVIDCVALAVSDCLPLGGQPRGIRFFPAGRRVMIANHAGWVDILPTGTQGALQAIAPRARFLSPESPAASA